jgi:AcrR family transcriptional regulator
MAEQMTMTTDGRRARGLQSRTAVLRLAMDAASVEGLDALTIGRLASAAQLSKSGVVALFGSKEQLQLAAIEAAREIFITAVIAPALTVAGGRARIDALLDGWITYSESRVFAGGCFFAAATAEFASRPGIVRDAVADQIAQWNDTLSRVITRAIDAGELSTQADVGQLVFEIRALLDGANSDSLLFGSSEPYERARLGLRRVLDGL